MLARRWLLYVATCAAVLGLQAAVLLLWHGKAAALFPALVGPPFVAAVVTVFVGGDATNALTMAQRWERVVERAWAIILIDVGISFVGGSALASMLAGDAADIILGFLTLLLSGMLVYAEPFVMLEKDAQPLTLIPFAILRSMMLSWVNMSRVFALLAVQIGADAIVQFADQKTGTNARVMVDVLLPAVLELPMAALFTVAYLDTLNQERRTLS